MKAFSTVAARSGAKVSASRAVTRQASSASSGSITPRCVRGNIVRITQQTWQPLQKSNLRPFTISHHKPKGLSPASSDPEPPETEDHNDSTQEAVDLADAEYHEIADQYMNTLQLTMEEIADKDAQQALEVEYSVRLPPVYAKPRHTL